MSADDKGSQVSKGLCENNLINENLEVRNKGEEPKDHWIFTWTMAVFFKTVSDILGLRGRVWGGTINFSCLAIV